MYSSASEQDMLAAIEQELRNILEANALSPPKNHMYGMLHYHMGWLDKEFKPVESNTGKRVRPMLCLLCCEAAGGDWRQAVPAAVAIELLHNFSLIHDDIQDQSPKRRGRFSLWYLWKTALALNAGDGLFTIAHLAMTRLLNRNVDQAIFTRALRRFDEAALHLTLGQHADLRFEGRSMVSKDEYVTMIKGKTASLISLATELGALIAGSSEEMTQNYADFGQNLGLAYQVRDDLLGIWGEETTLGKSTSSDIINRKKTLPILYGLEHNQELLQLYTQPQLGNNANFVSRTMALLDKTGAHGFTTKQANHYTEYALHHLIATEATNGAYLTLRHLTNKLAGRVT